MPVLRQALPFARQIPGLGGLLTRLGGAPAAGTALRSAGNVARNVAGFGLPGPAGSAARAFGAFTLGTAGLNAITGALSGGGGGGSVGDMAQAAQLQQLQGVGGQADINSMIAMGGGVITKVWQPWAGSPVFARVDYPGSRRRTRIVYQRLDGSIGTYVPKRHLVISSNPRVKDLVKADRRLTTMTRNLERTYKRRNKRR